MWRLKNPSKPFQLIACRDIGVFASTCFLAPESWNNKALGLAGSEITLTEANEIFKEKTGLPALPETSELLVKGMFWAMKDLKLMFEFFANVQYGADIPELKKIHPGLMSWDEWLVKESGWVKSDA